MMAINMAIVPVQLRMLFINVVSLFWTYKLSAMSSAAPQCDAQILELTKQDAAPVTSAASVADILSALPEEAVVRPWCWHCIVLLTCLSLSHLLGCVLSKIVGCCVDRWRA